MKATVVLSLLLVLSSVILSAPPTTAAGSSSDTDAESYAARFQVSIAEATHRLALQREAGDLDQALTDTEAEPYAGLWIEHTPRFRVRVRFTEGGAASLARHPVSSALKAVLGAEPATHTLADLRRQLWSLSDLPSPRPFEAGTNVVDNIIDMRTTSL